MRDGDTPSRYFWQKFTTDVRKYLELKNSHEERKKASSQMTMMTHSRWRPLDEEFDFLFRQRRKPEVSSKFPRCDLFSLIAVVPAHTEFGTRGHPEG